MSLQKNKNKIKITGTITLKKVDKDQTNYLTIICMNWVTGE